MKKLLLLYLAFNCYGSLSAQPTFALSYQESDFLEVNNFLSLFFSSSEEKAFEKSYVLTFGRLIPLKNNWITFHPNLALAIYKPVKTGDDFLPRGLLPPNLYLFQADLSVGPRFYIFNIFRRSVAPYKSSRDYLKQAFYISINPTLSIYRQRYSTIDYTSIGGPSSSDGEQHRLYFRNSLGFGFDMKVMDWFILTPYFTWNQTYEYSNQILLDQLRVLCGGCPALDQYIEPKSDIIQFTFGVILCLNFLE